MHPDPLRARRILPRLDARSPPCRDREPERSRGEADSDPDTPSQDADEEYAEDYPDDTPAVVENETVAAPTETVDSDAEEVAEEDSNPR